MNIAVLGGGPAGLYFAWLHRRRNPRDRIRVLDRVAPALSSGWGLSFSGAFLRQLYEEDPPAHHLLRDQFVPWSATEVRWREEKIRLNESYFVAIERRKLLVRLADECANSGARLDWNHPLAPPSRLLEEFDLVVGADGAHSMSRAAFAPHFRPTVRVGRNHYRWLGVDRAYGEFRLLFAKKDGCFFNAYLYPHSPCQSTFVVECDGPAFEAADLGFLEALFERDLDGGRLRARGGSGWTRFSSVSTERQVYRNLVLIGDSAHALHFSIGSGTRLAMQDARQLADSLERVSTLPDALLDYETKRRSEIASWMQAANNSRRFFESLRSREAQSPTDFARGLFTRRGRYELSTQIVRDLPEATLREAAVTLREAAVTLREAAVTPREAAG